MGRSRVLIKQNIFKIKGVKRTEKKIYIKDWLKLIINVYKQIRI